MRIIDADKLKANMFYHEIDNVMYAEERDIDEQPTVDAVPVVRCAECKYHWKNGGDCVAEADWFCADGERRTE